MQSLAEYKFTMKIKDVRKYGFSDHPKNECFRFFGFQCAENSKGFSSTK